MFHIYTKHTRKITPHWDSIFVNESPAKRVVHKTHTSAYDRHGLATDIYRACIKVFGFAGEAEKTAVEVCKRVETWLLDKQEVTEADIKRQASRALQMYNPRAAYAFNPIKEYSVTEDQYGFIRL